jgi:hypothetical protein
MNRFLTVEYWGNMERIDESKNRLKQSGSIEGKPKYRRLSLEDDRLQFSCVLIQSNSNHQEHSLKLFLNFDQSLAFSFWLNHSKSKLEH